MIAAVLAIIVGLVSYIYYLHTQRSRQPSLDLHQLTSAVYDEQLFTAPFTEKDAYLDTKKQLLTAAGKADSEQSVSDLAAEARKQLDGLLLKRAVAAIERGNAINRELENVRAMQSNGLLAPAQVQSIQAAIKAVEQEHRDIRDEASIVRHNWGELIFRQAYAMSPTGIQALRDSREKQQTDGPRDNTDKNAADGTVPAAAAGGGGGGAARVERGEPAKMSKKEEEELKRKEASKAKEADKAYQRLMEEEERNAQKKGSKKKDEGAGGTGSKKGSKK